MNESRDGPRDANESGSEANMMARLHSSAPAGGTSPVPGGDRVAAVLLLADAPEVREGALRTLRAAGYRVGTAVAVPDAAALGAGGEVDVVVLGVDVRTTGRAAICRWLKSDPQTAGLPLLLVMAGGPAEAEVDACLTVAAGAAALVATVRRLRRGGRGAVERDAAGPARRVLVVDDNVDSADSLRLLVECYGYEGRTAYGGPAALDVAEAFRPDAILLDISMPLMSGFEVARRIRALPGQSAVVLIAQTGWVRAADHAQGTAAGFDHHLAKPLDCATLQAILASVPFSR